MEEKRVGRVALVLGGLALSATAIGVLVGVGMAEPTAVSRIGAGEGILIVVLVVIAAVGFFASLYGAWLSLEIGRKRLARVVQAGERILASLTVTDGWREFLSSSSSESIARRMWKWQKGATAGVPHSNRPAWERIWDDNYAGVRHGSSPEDNAVYE